MIRVKNSKYISLVSLRIVYNAKELKNKTKQNTLYLCIVNKLLIVPPNLTQLHTHTLHNALRFT